MEHDFKFEHRKLEKTYEDIVFKATPVRYGYSDDTMYKVLMAGYECGKAEKIDTDIIKAIRDFLQDKIKK